MLTRIVKAIAWSLAWTVFGALGASLVILFGTCLTIRGPTARPTEPILTVAQFRDVLELATLRIEVSDVLEAQLTGATGGVSAVVFVRGDVDVSIDLAGASVADVDPAARTATLKLPAPVVSRPRINHAATRVVSVRRHGLWSLVPAGVTTLAGVDESPEAAAVARAMADGEARVAAAGEDADAQLRARARAERVMTDRARHLGWSLRVVWNDG